MYKNKENFFKLLKASEKIHKKRFKSKYKFFIPNEISRWRLRLFYPGA